MRIIAEISETTRKIKLPIDRVLSVNGDYQVDEIAFKLPDTYEGDFDFRTGVTRVHWKGADGAEHAEVLVSVDSSGRPLWVLPAALTQGGDGVIEFSVSFSMTDASDHLTQRWKTKPAAFRNERGIGGNDEQAEDDEIYDRLASAVASVRAAQAEVEDTNAVLSSLTGSAPVPVENRSDMVDNGHLYLYTGDETSFVAGNLYYYVNGTLTNGGPYGAVTLDATLSQSGQAADAAAVGEALDDIDADVAQIKEDLSDISPLSPVGLYSGSDLLGASANYTGKMENGVTYTWDSEHSACTANGTASGTSFSNVYNNKSSLPAGIEAGKTYYVTCTTTDANLRLQVLFYSSDETLITNFYITKNGYFDVPANAVGMLARVRVPGTYTVTNAVISNMAFYEANDVTADIITRLTTYGVCYLRDGVYPVRSLDMPDNTSIIGIGADSVVRFIDTGDGYTIKPSAGSHISNLKILGGEDAPVNVDIVGAALGTKHGIYLDGTLTEPFIADGCYIINFDGSGVYAENTGGSIRGFMIVSNCYIRKCMVGINLASNVEYNTFNAIRITGCNRACINNGGNNTFAGCEFHGVVGFSIDGTQPNSGHGTCTGCTFNHIDNVNQSTTLGGGDAIKIDNLTNGFIFDACQFWYGAINLSNSRGVTVCNSQIGDARQNPHITVTGSYPAFFNNIIFHQAPVISDSANSKFTACYLDSDGSAVTG